MIRLFDIVKRYYEAGYYGKEDVAKFVRMKKITSDQYKEITGEDYK